MLMIQNLVFVLFKLMCLVRTNEITERSICLRDLLAFYDTSVTSCSFKGKQFTSLYKDSQRTCLVKCTLKKLTPELQSRSWHGLEKLEIHFLNTYLTFRMMKSCTQYENINVKIAVECDERGFYDRRIGESCKEESHCNVSNPYSTCSTTNGVCECKKGYFAKFNTCFQVANNRDPPVGIIVGAAAAGFVSGIIVCGIVCVMLSRCKKATSAKRSVEFAATVDSYGIEVAATSAGKSEEKRVQVSEESSQNDGNRKGGTVPLDGIYNHLHETSVMLGIEPEYDHVPCNDTDEETYHHLNLGNTKNVNTATLADLENHYN